MLASPNPAEGAPALIHDGANGYLPPAAFGPFRVLHQVGVGVLGPVFRTYEPNRDRLIAVKVFRLDLTPEQAHDLSVELDRVADLELTHPSLVPIVAAGVEETTAFVALDYVAAESLDIALRHYAPAPLDRALPFVTQLAGALDFAAAAGVYHGALHPRDVFVTPEEARVGGFGVAQALERVGAQCPIRRPYSAPERIDGSPWGRPADVFALAAIAFELLTGRRIVGVGADAVATLGDGSAGLDDRMAEVFGAALALAPRDRFQSALAFASALEAASRGQGWTLGAGPAYLVEPGGGSPAIEPANGVAAAGAPVELPEPTAIVDLRDAPPNTEPPPFRPAPAAVHMLPAGDVRPPQAPSSLFEDVERSQPGAPLDDFDARLESEPAENESEAPPIADEPSVMTSHSGVNSPPSVSRHPTHRARGLFESHASPAVERGRSAMLPVAVGVMIGTLVGFIAGYGLGSHERTTAPVSIQEVGSLSGPPASTAPTESASGRAWSEESLTAPEAEPDVVAPAPPSPEPPARTAIARGSGRPADVTAEASRSPAAAAPAEPNGRLLIRSTPAGAVVAVNGRPRGSTPMALRDLQYGTYSVRVSRPGYEPVIREFVLSRASPLAAATIELRATGTAPAMASAGAPPRPSVAESGSVLIDSRPRGARVFLDDRLVGTTPLLVSGLKAGLHVVRIERVGYPSWTDTVAVIAGQRTRIAASLDRGSP